MLSKLTLDLQMGICEQCSQLHSLLLLAGLEDLLDLRETKLTKPCENIQ